MTEDEDEDQAVHVQRGRDGAKRDPLGVEQIVHYWFGWCTQAARRHEEQLQTAAAAAEGNRLAHAHGGYVGQVAMPAMPARSCLMRKPPE